MFTRRTLAAGLAALPIATTTAAAAGADPIFGAIARHRVAKAALGLVDEVAEPAAYAACEQEIFGSYEALLATPPRTIAGCKALVDFTIEDAGEDDVQALDVLRLALDRLAAA